MTLYGGYLFYTCLILALIPAILLGVMQKPLRLYTLGISIVFICLVLAGDIKQLLCFSGFFLAELAIVKGYLLLRIKYGRNEKLYYITVFLSILPLILNKCSPIFNLNVFGIIGISYLTFRTVQMVIEIYDGIITEVPAFEYAGFILFFPALSCGPIDRSRRFHEDWVKVYKREEYLELVGTGLFKILLGLIYKLILAVQFYKWMGFFDGNQWYCGIGYAYLYGFYLFFDFAGYSMMAVGTSYILGIQTPDNFRRPFIAKDMRDFWDRWHISLSYWFRDFIFSRFIMKCVKKKWFDTRLQRASAGFIVNMFIMGMWHGLTISYLLYGLYHGVLLALTEIYQKKSQFYKKNKDQKAYRFMSWFVTLQLVMFGFLIFSGKFVEILNLGGN
ncbi:D-alanyl-lipoteichoic acid biosynthesis protein DltB [Aminipila terrae]|uniref:Teichoic acid D-alanyltransferase n=1 Tax=Aminipila terrae TaxID=2697030 RepID=A0A6P1MGF2_9FIRM|nr:D-alanyl-lipoteichoic acid biosynthesis protein DltB [Aminipila terrae]QHI72977.1 D-alanyl-lipoteichoic acid biosynthesis protein DltB [Aminipila terrae]